MWLLVGRIVGDHDAIADLHPRSRIVVHAYMLLLAVVLVGHVVGDGLADAVGDRVATILGRGEVALFS